MLSKNKMKILVMCPGSFTYGLDSPERGESRWSQNYAKMLAMAGHQVFAASMGKPEPRSHYGVSLINEAEVTQYGPYDLYIDSSWWKDKLPKGKASKYVILKWSLEEYTREEPLADNLYLAHPYPSHRHEFINGVNANKTFALPTMFGTVMETPKWGNSKIFLPGKIDTNRDYQRFIPAISQILTQYPVEGCSKDFFKKELEPSVNFSKSDSYWYNLLPYNEVLESMKRCKINLPILNPGAIIEATFQGIPSIFWEHGGFYNPLAENLGVLIQHHAEPERFIEVINMTMKDKKTYHEILLTSQDYFSCHLYHNAIKYFNLMVNQIF